MPIYAASEVTLEDDAERYLSNLKNYTKITAVGGYDLYKGHDSHVSGPADNYIHLVAFDGQKCIYSCYYFEHMDAQFNYIECVEVRQARHLKGFARKVAFEYLLPSYGSMRMSVGATDEGVAMWEKFLPLAPFSAIVEARLDGDGYLKESDREVQFTTNREPTTPVYLISNSRINL